MQRRLKKNDIRERSRAAQRERLNQDARIQRDIHLMISRDNVASIMHDIVELIKRGNVLGIQATSYMHTDADDSCMKEIDWNQPEIAIGLLKTLDQEIFLTKYLISEIFEEVESEQFAINLINAGVIPKCFEVFNKNNLDYDVFDIFVLMAIYSSETRKIFAEHKLDLKLFEFIEGDLKNNRPINNYLFDMNCGYLKHAWIPEIHYRTFNMVNVMVRNSSNSELDTALGCMAEIMRKSIEIDILPGTVGLKMEFVGEVLQLAKQGKKDGAMNFIESVAEFFINGSVVAEVVSFVIDILFSPPDFDYLSCALKILKKMIDTNQVQHILKNPYVIKEIEKISDRYEILREVALEILGAVSSR